MDFDAYSAQAEKTAIYPGQGSGSGLVYVALGVAGEAGEIANKIKKLYRDGDSPAAQDALFLEIGDALWYLDRLCNELGTTLSVVAELNVDKLRARFDAGTLRGGGDGR